MVLRAFGGDTMAARLLGQDRLPQDRTLLPRDEIAGVDRGGQTGEDGRRFERAGVAADHRGETRAALLEAGLGLRQGGADDEELRLGLGDVGAGQVALALAKLRLRYLPLVGSDRASLNVGQFEVAAHREMGVDDLEHGLVFRLAKPLPPGEHVGLRSRHLRRAASAAAQQLRHRQRGAHRALFEPREPFGEGAALQAIVVADRRASIGPQPIGRARLDHAFV